MVPHFYYSCVLAEAVILPSLTRPDPREYAGRTKMEAKKDATSDGDGRTVVRTDHHCAVCGETLTLTSIEYLRHKITCKVYIDRRI